MKAETEAKFKVADINAVGRALAALGAEEIALVVQTDTYFDFPDESLRRGDRGLRLRRVKELRAPAAEFGAILTYKGPRCPNAQVKIRQEVETPVADADAMAEILTACGLVESMIIQKRRRSFRLGQCRIELDELPLLGFFVEIEAPDEEQISSVRDRLPLPHDAITAPYTELASQYCRSHGIDDSRVVFGG